MKNQSYILFILLAIVLSSCGSGSDHGVLQVDPQRYANANDKFVILDIESGKVTTTGTTPDMTDTKYKTTHIAFSRIPMHTDETTKQTVSAFYIATTECTQAQWRLLLDEDPWADILPKDMFGEHTYSESTDTVLKQSYPAFGISEKLISDNLSSMNEKTVGKQQNALRLPTTTEWTFAARGGSSESVDYSWQTDASTDEFEKMSNYALVRETASNDGAQIVASLESNGYGLYDMHGNLWEITKKDDSTSADIDADLIFVQGGSWYNNSFLSKLSIKRPFDKSVDYGLTGVRFVLADEKTKERTPIIKTPLSLGRN